VDTHLGAEGDGQHQEKRKEEALHRKIQCFFCMF
jgi:hypothetical protein